MPPRHYPAWWVSIQSGHSTQSPTGDQVTLAVLLLSLWCNTRYEENCSTENARKGVTLRITLRIRGHGGWKRSYWCHPFLSYSNTNAIQKITAAIKKYFSSLLGIVFIPVQSVARIAITAVCEDSSQAENRSHQWISDLPRSCAVLGHLVHFEPFFLLQSREKMYVFDENWSIYFQSSRKARSSECLWRRGYGVARRQKQKWIACIGQGKSTVFLVYRDKNQKTLSIIYLSKA